MTNIRQSILIRTDLNLPTGLMAAQVAHIHALPLLKSMTDGTRITELLEWKDNPYIYVHQVPNLEVLTYFSDLFDGATKIQRLMWHDTVTVNISPTQTKAFKLTVGMSIGPCDADLIKEVIGDLPLL